MPLNKEELSELSKLYLKFLDEFPLQIKLSVILICQ